MKYVLWLLTLVIFACANDTYYLPPVDMDLNLATNFLQNSLTKLAANNINYEIISVDSATMQMVGNDELDAPISRTIIMATMRKQTGREKRCSITLIEYELRVSVKIECPNEATVTANYSTDM